ncbi:WYL domain-containing protein [Flammeovirgaceae bacterium SG7u.111]|nr:WYL domain-containing protein [Flammeovirgaceae bacterium SG7u.132]WPO38159.1 WYL domain-containing protein [Flammeovirgaceae bacterium SG7u.111]
MAQNKYAFARYKIIDRELSRKDYVKTADLVDICLKECEMGITVRSIQKDIQDMQTDSFLGYYAPIEYDKSKKAYFYADSKYSITGFGLKEEEINTLQIFAGKLNLYKNYPIFKDFSTAIEKVLQAVQIRKSLKNVEQRQYIQTQNIPMCLGTEFIPNIVTALEEQKIIEFEYQKYGDNNIKKRILYPYLLKEDSNRWYIIGKLKGKKQLTTFAIDDRIKSLYITSEYFSPDKIDFDEYFKYSFGISVFDEPVTEVILSFDAHQGFYIKSLPLHSTQKVLVDNNEELRISIQVKPSYEFYSKILSYGKAVKVVSPNKLQEEIKVHIDALSKIY